MKLLASLLSKVYQYVTAFIVISSPLFFIPGTAFSPDVTYQITITIAIAVALSAYGISASITRSWHTISKLEFLAYILFSLSLLGSVVFARNPETSLFGEAFSPYAVASLAALPAVMYLVRALPESLRHKLKLVMLAILGLSSLAFICLMIINGTFMAVLAKIFGGFSSAVSLSAYLGLFVVGLFVYLRKTKLSSTYRLAIGFASIVILAWVVGVASTENVRPNLASSLTVSKQVLLHDGVFGIGAGDYARAWQLYRPQSVVNSAYFGTEFNQGFGTTTTLLTTIGLAGLLAFLLLTLSALYSTYRSYRQAHEENEKTILGILLIVLVYFSVLAWIIPLSYAMLVTWMVVSGFGLARAKLTEFHPSKKMASIVIPIAIILIAYSFVTINKARAFMYFAKAQASFSAQGPSQEVDTYMAKAIAILPYDGFYRAKIEYIISVQRTLIATETQDQEALKQAYLKNAEDAVNNAGLAAVKVNPSNYQNYVSLGRAYELAIPFDKEGGYARAKKSYEEAIKLYPNNPYLYVMIARLEAQAGTKEAVRTQLTEALKKKQNFADALYLMSQLEASDEKLDEAIAYALEAVKSAPNDPLVYIQAGLLFYGKKDYQNAVTALQTGLQKDPNNANIAYFLALSLRDGGRPDLAKEIGDELLKRNPGNPDLETFLKSLEATETPSSTPAAKK
jgi:tetratricopeptide (TPR) repeat protein